MLVRPSGLLPGANGIAIVAGVNEGQGVRGYFLVQQFGSPAGTNDFVAFAGNMYVPASQQTVLDTLQSGHWYYYATTFHTPMGGPSGLNETQMTSYIADLTAGATTLTSLGTFTTPGGNIFTNGVAIAPLGVGILDNSIANGSPSYGFAFPGGIDALALYTGQLNQSVLQSHLDAIWAQESGPVPAPEPDTFALMLFGLDGRAVRRRKRRSE